MRWLIVIFVLGLAGFALSKEPKAGPEVIQGRTFEGIVGEALRLEGRENVTVRDCTFRNVGVAIRLVNCRGITIESCAMSDLTIMGIDIRGGCSDIRILNNRLTGFRDDVQGGHLISTEKTEKPLQKRITIAGNTLIGNGKSFVPGRKDGAAGDMIALRSVSGFSVRHNDLSDGGEFGMNCLYSCENGEIVHNRIHRTDGTGLLIGYGVKNVTVIGNVIVDTGCSFETDESKNDITHQAGIHCRNGVENVLIASNLIVREEAPEMRYGIHLRETTGTIEGNRIVGVEKKVHVPKSLVKTVKID